MTISETPATNALRARFRRAALAAGASQPVDPVFDELLARYSEPHRHYHTLGHIDRCLVWLDWFSGAAEHAEEVELALWFHDAVYSLGEPGSERRSAELARERLGALGIDAAAVDRVAHHVEATERHSACSRDSALVVDLDLAILGAPPDEFDAFECAIRAEYALVAEPMYRDARGRVLNGFLERRRIYEVPAIGVELEGAARRNLSRRIRELSAESGAVAPGVLG